MKKHTKKMTCRCGTTFLVNVPQVGRPRKYCTRKCRRKAHIERKFARNPNAETLILLYEKRASYKARLTEIYAVIKKLENQ